MSELASQPVPCARCGAGMVPAQEGVRYDNLLHLACRYCGARETLAHDDRLRVSRERIGFLRMAQDAAEAPARHAEQLIALRPWLGGLAVGGIMLLNGLNNLWQTTEALSRAGAAMSADARFDVLLTACAMPAAGVGLAGGMFLGWTLALRRYRDLVTPLRRARAPLAPGAPARCRCCGADLPAQWGAFVTCQYCNSANLLDRALLDARESLLVQETAMHQQRAAGVIAQANAFSPTFSRWSLAGAAAGAALGGALGVALAVLLARA